MTRQVAEGYYADASTPPAHRRRRDVTFAIGQHGPCIKYSAGAFDTVHTLLNVAGATRANERLSYPMIAVHDGHTLQHDELLHELVAGTIYVLGADEQRAEDSEIVAEQEREPRPKRMGDGHPVQTTSRARPSPAYHRP
jgi:hypothetical protein